MPMRIVVSDSSCVIDLGKVSMLELLLRLPYEFLIPNTMFEEELLTFTAAQKKALIRAGLRVVDLPGERVLRAQAIVRELPRLSVHDGFAFALAESHHDCILLSGDDGLRTLAAKHAIEVHGVLWVLDQLHANRLAEAPAILNVLQVFLEDTTVHLPRREVPAYIKRYEAMQ
jgi:predicted nucleic acid-binding protein